MQISIKPVLAMHVGNTLSCKSAPSTSICNINTSIPSNCVQHMQARIACFLQRSNIYNLRMCIEFSSASLPENYAGSAILAIPMVPARRLHENY